MVGRESNPTVVGETGNGRRTSEREERRCQWKRRRGERGEEREGEEREGMESEERREEKRRPFQCNHIELVSEASATRKQNRNR